MPHFVAQLSKHNRLVGEVFVLDVEMPQLGPGPAFGAAICENIHRSYVAEPLARRCAVQGTSGRIMIRIKGWSGFTLRLHEFDPVSIKFFVANPMLGPNYVGLGIADLEPYFDLERREPRSPTNPSPPFIFLEPLAHCRHHCHQH